MKKTIIVLTIETNKKPPENLNRILENRAHDFLKNAGIAVGNCNAAVKTTDVPE